MDFVLVFGIFMNILTIFKLSNLLVEFSFKISSKCPLPLLIIGIKSPFPLSCVISGRSRQIHGPEIRPSLLGASFFPNSILSFRLFAHFFVAVDPVKCRLIFRPNRCFPLPNGFLGDKSRRRVEDERRQLPPPPTPSSSLKTHPFPFISPNISQAFSSPFAFPSLWGLTNELSKRRAGEFGQQSSVGKKEPPSSNAAEYGAEGTAMGLPPSFPLCPPPLSLTASAFPAFWTKAWPKSLETKLIAPSHCHRIDNPNGIKNRFLPPNGTNGNKPEIPSKTGQLKAK